MAWYDKLLDQGYVPKGVAPNVVVEPGGEPGRYQTDPLSTALRTFDKFQKESRLEQERVQKVLSKQTEMYKTLRDSGYEPKRAYEAVKKMQFPEVEGGETSKETLEGATLEKTQAQTEYYKSKTPISIKEAEEKIKLIDAQILKLNKESEALSDPLGKEKKQKQVEKLNAQIELIKSKTEQPGEEGQELSGMIEKDRLTKDVMIPMLRPDGTPTRVHKDDVTKALKKGYKRR